MILTWRTGLTSAVFVSLIVFTGCKQQTNPAETDRAATSTTAIVTPATNLSGSTAAPAEPIMIVFPAQGAKVDHRLIVRGIVANPHTKVWVVVRPMRTSDYWIQPPVDVDKDGSWSTQVYIGQASIVNSGELFKVMAIGDPVNPLQEGERLRDWPPARWQSKIVEVVKR